MPSLSQRLEQMMTAAQAAGEGLRRDFANLANLEVMQKTGPADLCSQADLRSESTLRETLAADYPDYGFLGEEGGLVEGRDRSHTWIVDPLDGTTNFLVGIPAFAVNLALAREGEVIAGVTYAPMLGEMFVAETGGGAFLNGRPIRVSGRQGFENAILGVGIPFLGKPRRERFHAEMQRLTRRVAGIRRLGAGAIDMAYVACGRYDAYWEQSVSAWDLAAGVVIVREAGGLVTDTAGKRLDIMNGTVLACTPQLFPMLLPELSPPG
jgi:myo-inositol-1(or 4)-monophosphatase